MKKAFILFAFISILYTNQLKAQGNNCELPLTVLIADDMNLPASASKNLYNKLHKLIIDNGISEEDGSRFVVSSNLTIMDKQILAGPPKSFIYEFELNLYIGDFTTKKIYNYATLKLKGVGQTEPKAYNDAMKKINLNSPELQKFITVGKQKVVEYYDKNYPQLIKEAQTLASQKHYEEALYTLMSIPTCSKGYDQVTTVGKKIYIDYANQLCRENLNLAKSAWAANQTVDGANEAGSYLANIYPDASCYKEAQTLYTEIKGRIKQYWTFEMKTQSDIIQAWREIGVAYGKNQPKETTTINWIN